MTSRAVTVEHAHSGRPCWGEEVSGDAAVICRDGDMLFAAVVDVLGHGPEAHQVAVEIESFLRDAWSRDLSGVIAQLHERLRGGRGACIGACVIDETTGRLHYAAIGNTVFRRFGAGETRLVSRSGTVGATMRSVDEQQVTLHRGDVVLLYTDGVSDRFQHRDVPTLFGLSPAALASAVVRRFGKEHDDATCIVLRCAT